MRAAAERPAPRTTCMNELLMLTREPLDPGRIIRLVTEANVSAKGEGLGGVASFLGIVRGRNRGQRVKWLEYDAYEPLAVRTFARIADEIAARWPDIRVAIHHRVGRLDVGDASVAIAAAGAHRAEAFAACRYAIERVKQIAPIWKHEYFDGGDVWIEGAVADPDDATAQADAVRVALADRM